MTSDALHFAVPSGIGDISWIYSKVVSLGRPLCFSVTGGRPRRAVPFLQLLPSVASAEYGRLSTEQVLRRGHHPQLSVAGLLTAARRQWMPLQLNTHLEHGHRVETYISDLPVTHHYEIRIPPRDVASAIEQVSPWRRYLTLYCANARTVAAWKGWQPADWSALAGRLVRTYELEGVVMIGADWDVPFAASIVNAISAERIPTKDLAGKLSIGASLEVVRRGCYLVAFPSGIPIVAAVMGRPVLMFYPDHLQRMQRAWADPAMIESGAYLACPFQDPDAVFGMIRATFTALEPFGAPQTLACQAGTK